MWNDLRRWLNDIPIHDPLERRQAGLFQVMLLIIAVSNLIGLALSFLVAGNGSSTISLISYSLLIVCTGGALALLRYGRFTPAVNLATIGLILAIGIALIAVGFGNSSSILLAFAVPITMSGLVLGRHGLLIAAGLSILIVVITGLLSALAPTFVGFMPSAPASALSIVPMYILIIGILSLFIDRFGAALRDALTATQAREQELEHLGAALEITVAERTASLQQALQEGEQRQARLAQALDDLRISQTTIHELSAPVIPVLPGVLIAPLIGALDSARAATLADNILGMVERTHADRVIFDITGVPVVDSHVAKVLLEAATAARLLGAQTLLVGIRPEVAQTIITLGIDFAALATYPSLQEAVAAILAARAESGLNSAEPAW
jgi:rsbT co-antagonist protein RsbR